MRRAFAWFLALAVPCLGLGAAAAAATRTEKDLDYADGAKTDEAGAHKLDLVLPVSAEPHPVPVPLLIFVHGGAWVSGSKGEYAPLAEAFANRGIAVALVNYRLSTSPKVVHPAHAEDLAAAVHFLNANAGKYGLNAGRIFVSGHSAGAHMTAYLASSPELLARAGWSKDRRPAGFIGLSGIYDVPKLQARFPGYRDWFLAKAFGDEKRWPEASPARRSFTGGAPWLLIHSKADELVDTAQSENFLAVLTAQNVKARLVTPGALDHFGTVHALFSAATPEARSVAAFINSGG